MLTATEFVNKYRLGNANERFEMMFSNYDQFDDILDLYRENIVFKILCEVEYQHSVERNQLDVRVQHSVGFSDAVFSEVNLRENIETLMDSEIYEARFGFYLYDNEELITEVRNYLKTKREIYIFKTHISKLRDTEKHIMIEFLDKDKSYEEIGVEMRIDSESVRKKIQRLKGKLRNGIIGTIDTRGM